MAHTSSGQIVKTKDQADNIGRLIYQNRGQFQAVLPQTITPERLARVTITALRQTPKLMRCTTPSLMSCIMQSAQLGLEIGNGLGHAYLVPYKNECTLIVGYKGMLNLARRSGQVSMVYATEVREKDTFSYQLGTMPLIKHDPFMGDRGEVTHFYAVAKIGIENQFEVMDKAEVDAIRARSRAGNSGPWVTDYEAMGRKTVLRRLCKVLPASIELQRAVVLDEAADANIPQSHDTPQDILDVAEAFDAGEHTVEDGEELPEEQAADMPPDDDPIMPWGKHEGERLRNLPAGYLRWLVKELATRIDANPDDGGSQSLFKDVGAELDQRGTER